MSLSSTSINRPVLAIVMSLVIVIFGVIGFRYLSVREYPSVDPPIITVSASYTGASADVMQGQVTEPLEEALNGIQGIKNLTSNSRDGRTQITVEFDLDADLETAANDVRDKVSGAQGRLPRDIDPPVVSKANADSQPIVMTYLSSDRRNLLELTDYANNTLKERLQTIPGVSEIRVYGERKYSMRLWLDPIKLSALGVSPVDVQAALTRENVELPSGTVQGEATQLTLRTMGRLSTVKDFNNMIIRQDETSLIRMSDVGYAELYPENDQTIFKVNGVPMVGLAVIPQPGSNQIDIADEFNKRLQIYGKDLPKDLVLKPGFDNSVFIRNSINEVEHTIIEAFVLVVIIIFLFLRDWRSTIIPVVAIPVSLVGIFFVMYLMDFSINVLTLLAIVLAIGLVVDDAIVVLENIYSRIEEGEDPKTAAIKGSEEILMAVVSTTIVLAAVFLPVVFLTGITGRLFREFGIVVAGSVLISAFVSLTLTPMMCSLLLKREEKHNWFYRKTEPFFEKMIGGYRESLETFLRNRWLAWVMVAGTGLGIWFFMKTIPSELAPVEDRSRININATGPEGASFDFMEEHMTELTKLIIDSTGEKNMSSVFTVTSPGFGGGSNSGIARVLLKNADERPFNQEQLTDKLSNGVKRLTAARTSVSQDQSIGNGGGGLPVQFVVQIQDFDKLRAAVPKFLEAARQDPTFQFVDVNLKFNKPELRVNIDREKAQSLGVSVQSISQTLQSGLSGQRYGYFIRGSKQYQIIGQVAREDRSQPLDVRLLSVKNAKGELIQLDNVIRLEESSTPPQLYRFNRYNSATFSASLAPGQTLGDGIAAMQAIADKSLDDTFSTELAGASRDFQESSSSLVFAFGLALVLIYLVLAAQFESFRDPVIIMVTVPLALSGALLSLWYFNQTLNLFSQIGIIMLVGLVTKNGILIVEFANQQVENGKDYMTGLIEGATARFRPILMTSLCAILGILPIAVASGAGALSRRAMGIGVVGGLFFATALTLYVVPVMYSYFATAKKHKQPVEEEKAVAA
ncbi:efflux RND transporter permease subunit [Hymenobacter taeanensis]|uniref:Efflux RND transporter permease subunit n=1 Tax=Hymenobacter taeanensis TaxID=2735321 RepID=A0A6M6BHU5_9BACT|nr:MULTISPECIES: efflux RND transporter permease subunit [Hymenobacter]QJX47666.1 efflux RND transporter permease subunit [Hymenobacter taeanensis]UOQ82851.1 efflux RND transporter permease subunit [Hymenobacter sp. 5414T-23]